MTNKCDRNFLEKITKHVGSPTGKKLLKEINSRAKELQATEGLDELSAINKATDEAAENHVAITKERTRQQLINMRIHKELKDFCFAFKNPVKGLSAAVHGIEGVTDVKGAKMSAAALQRQWLKYFFPKLISEMDGRGVLDSYKDPVNGVDVFREASGEDTGNKHAKGIYEALRATYEEGRKLLNKFGAAIGDLSEYIGSQMHDGNKMLRLSDNFFENRKLMRAIKKASKSSEDFVLNWRNAAYDKWKNHILPRLDQARTFKGRNPDEFLRGAFDNIIIGRYNTIRGGDPKDLITFEGPGNIAKNVSARRVFHFKDGVSAYEYNSTYGHGSLHEMVAKSFQNLSENAGFMQKFGVNGNAMVKRLMKETEEEALKRGIKEGAVKWRLRAIEHTVDNINGSLRVPLDNMIAKISTGIRSLNGMAKLGAVALRAFPDIGLAADQLRANGMGFLESEWKAFSGVMKGFLRIDSKETRAVSDLAGGYFDSYLQHMAGGFTGIDSTLGTFSKMQSTFFRVGGMTKFDDIKNRSLTQTLSRFLWQNRNISYDALNKSLKERLFEHGIEGREWDLMRSKENLATPWGRRSYILPDAARDYSNESIAQYLGKDVSELTPQEIEKVKENMELQLRTYFVNNSENVNMLPSAREQAMLNQGLDPNTPMGIATRLIMQFRGFTLSFTRRKLGRIFGKALMYGFSRETFGGQEFIQLAQLMGMGTVYGYLSWALISLAKGETPPDPTEKNNFFESMLRGNSFGIYGDFLSGQWMKYNGLAEELGGPTYSNVADAAQIFNKIAHGRDPSYSAYQFARNNTPFLNLWYARAALNYAFLYGIQEHLSPGSLQRMKDNLEERTGQKFIIDPNHALGAG